MNKERKHVWRKNEWTMKSNKYLHSYIMNNVSTNNMDEHFYSEKVDR
jgi:hypothetical protein